MNAQERKEVNIGLVAAGYDKKIHVLIVKNWTAVHLLSGFDTPHFMLYIHDKKSKRYKFYHGEGKWTDWLDQFYVNSIDIRVAQMKTWVCTELQQLGFSDKAIEILFRYR